MNYSAQTLSSEFRIDELPSGQRAIAEVIGVEATLKLCEVFGDEKPYIPRNDAL